jgi:Tol biopolymer transport system component
MRNAIGATAAVVLLLVAAACGGGSREATPVERHLVYVRGNGISAASVWIADVSGAHSRRLAPGYVGVLSPDGRTVAVARRGHGIFLVSSNGRRVRRLTERRLRPQAWSPDGQMLIATVETEHAVAGLVEIDRSGRIRTIARGSLYGFDFSPSGDELVYSRAPESTFEGICGDQFDLYVAKLDGGDARRLTHDGLSAFPVWGQSGIALSHFPASSNLQDCAAPGIWMVDSDGSHLRPVIARAPDTITLSGFYGLQPRAWLDEHHLLVGLRSESGTEGAVLNLPRRRLRRLNDYADEASRDGRFSVGSGGDQTLALSILRIHDGHRVFRREASCCPDWNR